jgi:hypothetical protein
VTDFLAACNGKRSFSSWSQAERTARRMRRDHRNDAVPYRCQWCSEVHIGTGTQQSRNGRRARLLLELKAQKRLEREAW